MSKKAYLLERDAINGAEGTAFITIDNEVHELFYIKSFTFKSDFTTSGLKVVGTRIEQEKILGAKLSGSLTIYFVTSMYAKIVENYIKTGKVTYFDIMGTIDDQNTTIGKMTVAIKKCKFNSIEIFSLNAESTFLEKNLEFTALDFDILEEFKKPEEVGRN